MHSPSSRVVTRLGAFTALSVVADLMPLPRAFWGMKLDLVGSVWVFSYLVYGLETAGLTSLLSFFIMSFYGPAGPIGAFMKLAATAPMFLMPWVIQKKLGMSTRSYAVGGAFALVVRVLLAFLLNYYIALPIFFGMSTPEVIRRFFGGSFLILFGVIASMNVAQGIIDLALPWALAFRLRLRKLLLYGMP